MWWAICLYCIVQSKKNYKVSKEFLKEHLIYVLQKTEHWNTIHYKSEISNWKLIIGGSSLTQKMNLWIFIQTKQHKWTWLLYLCKYEDFWTFKNISENKKKSQIF